MPEVAPDWVQLQIHVNHLTITPALASVHVCHAYEILEGAIAALYKTVSIQSVVEHLPDAGELPSLSGALTQQMKIKSWRLSIWLAGPKLTAAVDLGMDIGRDQGNLSTI